MGIENDFLEKLREIIDRGGRGYQASLAKALGIKPTTFSNMVNGRRGMGEDVRIKVSKIVGIDYSEMVRAHGEGCTQKSKTSGDNSPALQTNGGVGASLVAINSTVTTNTANGGKYTVTLTPLEYEVFMKYRELRSPEIVLEGCLERMEDMRKLFAR